MMKKTNPVIYTTLLVALTIALCCCCAVLGNEKPTNKHVRQDYTISLIGAESQMPASDFYITISASNPWVVNDIQSVSKDNDIYLLVGNRITNKEVDCQIRTEWDEFITDIIIDLDNDNYINGRHIVPIYNKLPIVEILSDKTAFNSMKNCEDKTISCEGFLYSPFITKGIPAKVKGRGNITWYAYAKKSYSIKLSCSADAFGIGRQKKWNYLANPRDKSLLRNKIWFDFAEALGLPYTPKNTLSHLFVNGVYQGIYQATTKIKQDKRYLPLSDGDYLFCLWEAEPDIVIPISSDRMLMPVQEGDPSPYAGVVYPKRLNDLQHAQATELLNELFGAINGADDTRLEQIMDMESFAKLYWLEEISMNVDALGRSIYIYWDASKGKFFAGPVWDMDCTLGADLVVDTVSFATPQGWKTRGIGWWKYLMEHPAFADCVNEVYYNRHIDRLMDKSVSEYQDYSYQYEPEFQLNYIESEGENEFDEIERDCSDYRSYTDDTIRFYKDRVQWIRSQMP